MIPIKATIVPLLVHLEKEQYKLGTHKLGTGSADLYWRLGGRRKLSTLQTHFIKYCGTSSYS